MTSKFRWVHGDTTHVVAPVASGTVIEIGDLVYYDVNTVKPASMQANQTTKALNQSTFAPKFLGVAMQASPADSTTPIRVATSGVFEYDCNANTFELGNYVGIEEKSGHTGIENQKLDKTTDVAGAIGRVWRREPAAVKTVQVQLQSVVMFGAVK
ncbi:MAG: hypothetical protein FWC50_02600 [Planctomycetaceae bacterium]|nr:hypothetical protein [Planctomycetaceae bacterium]